MLLLWQGLYGAPPGITQAGYISLIGYWIGGGGSSGGSPGSADDWIIRFRRRRGR